MTGGSQTSEVRCRIDAARQLLERVDELGEQTVVSYAIQLLITAAEHLDTCEEVA